MVAEKEERQKDPLSLPPATRKMRSFSMALFFLLGFASGAFVFWNPFDISFLLPSGPGGHSHGEGALSEARSPTQLWTCPMHPEVIEKEAGDCPLCHMKLVPVSSLPEESAKGERVILYWQAPMDPSYVSDQPGKSPMGMDLVPVYASEKGEIPGGGVVEIEAAIVQQMGVRTEKVRSGQLRAVIRTVGILDYNEKYIYLVNTKFGGWIEKVYVNYVGEKVREGGKLFEIYSPELVSTQEEYLTVLEYLGRMKRAGQEEVVEQTQALMEAARKRLIYWDISEGQILNLEKTG